MSLPTYQYNDSNIFYLISLDPFQVQYYPERRFQEFAIRKNPHAIKHVPSPDHALQTLAVTKDVESVKWIEYPFLDIQQICIDVDCTMIGYIKNADESIQKEVITRDWKLIKLIKSPLRDVQLLAMELSNDKARKFIDNPVDEILILEELQGIDYDANKF